MGKHQTGMPREGGIPVEYEWYADLFFLEEAYRDVLIVWLAAVLLRRRTVVQRLMGAGIVGGLCSTGIVYLELMGRCPAGGQTVFAGIWEVGKMLVTGFLMIWIAFPEKQTMRQEKREVPADSGDSWMKVFKCHGKALGVLVLSAGILQSGLAILRERCFLTGWKSLMFMGFFCVGIRFFAAALVRWPMVGKTRYQVRLFLNEKSKEFTAMADSGNRLVEPVTGKPVSIIAAADAKEFLGEKVGVIMIPYRAVGTKNGMLPGVLFDRMEVITEECGSVKIDRPVVAVSKEPLFFGKDFTMILPECLLKDGKG